MEDKKKGFIVLFLMESTTPAMDKKIIKGMVIEIKNVLINFISLPGLFL